MGVNFKPVLISLLDQITEMLNIINIFSLGFYLVQAILPKQGRGYFRVNTNWLG